MANNKEPIFIAKVVNSALSFVNADGTTAKSLVTANTTFGSAITGIFCTSDDTSAVVIDVSYNNGTSDFLIGSVNVPTLSGTDGSTVGVNLLDATLMPALVADGSLTVAPQHVVKVAPQSAVTAAKTVNIFAEYGDFGE